MRACIERALRSGPEPAEGGDSAFEFQFAREEPVFAGHFPGYPLLPGVFQIEMARVAAERVLGRPLAIEKVSKAKFSRAILPGEPIRLELRLRAEGSKVQARAKLSVGGERAGETALELAPEG